MFEIVQGIQAWMAAIHLIRPHSYEAMVLMSSLTECRFLSSVASDRKGQIEALMRVWQEVKFTVPPCYFYFLTLLSLPGP